MQFLYCVLKNALKIIKMINFYVHSFSFSIVHLFFPLFEAFYVFKCPYSLRRMVFRRLVWDVFLQKISDVGLLCDSWQTAPIENCFSQSRGVELLISILNFPGSDTFGPFSQLTKIRETFGVPSSVNRKLPTPIHAANALQILQFH